MNELKFQRAEASSSELMVVSFFPCCQGLAKQRVGLLLEKRKTHKHFSSPKALETLGTSNIWTLFPRKHLLIAT